MADIGINAPGLKPYPVRSGVATSTGCTYGVTVLADNGTNNFRDVKKPSAAKDQGVAGVVTTKEAAGTVGEGIEIAKDGAVVEVLLEAGATCSKENEAIVANASGHVKPIGANTGALDVVGRFKQNATAGATAIFVALEVGIYSKVVA